MSPWELATLAAICLAGAASPGPSLAIVVSASLNGGRGAGMSAAWAHALGVGLYAALTVAGISAIVTQQGWLFTGVQIAGALYLLRLAARLWSQAVAAQPDGGGKALNPLQAARAGFAIAFLNPKLAVFMLALFSQFVRPGEDWVTQLSLVAVAGLVDGLWYSLIALVFTGRRWIETLRLNAGRIDRGFAILLALVALVILFRSLASIST